MPLPPLIEIIPVPGPVQATVTIPGSKSITNRALILAALSENPRELKGALWSEDTEAMRDCLERLGIHMLLVVDPDEPANRSIRFLSTGLNSIAKGGTPERPLELQVQTAHGKMTRTIMVQKRSALISILSKETVTAIVADPNYKLLWQQVTNNFKGYNKE